MTRMHRPPALLAAVRIKLFSHFVDGLTQWMCILVTLVCVFSLVLLECDSSDPVTCTCTVPGLGTPCADDAGNAVNAICSGASNGATFCK